ncbi:hypothetical protein Tco_1159485 [Tanacetum coccineum]
MNDSIHGLIADDDDFMTPTKNVGLKIMDDAMSELAKLNYVQNRFAKHICDNVDTKNTITFRASPNLLKFVLDVTNEYEKKAIRDIGFGSVIKFKIDMIPKALGRWLVDHFDANTCSLMYRNTKLEITGKSVHEILGVPNGNIKINLVSRASNKGEYTKLVMGESIKMGTANYQFMSSIKSLKDVNNMDWCGYIVECLKKTKINWNGRWNFNGPMTFLALFYVHSTTMGKGKENRNVPAIRYWNSEMLRAREKEDLESGRMRYVGEIPAETSIKVEKVEYIASNGDNHKDANTSRIRKLEKIPCETMSVLTSEFEKIVNMFVKIDGVIGKRLNICPGDPFIGNFMMTISDKMKETSQSYLKRADEVFNIISDVGHLTTTGKGGQPKTLIFESPTFLTEVE